MDYQISGVPFAEFGRWLASPADALRAAGIEVVVADAPHAFPCRLTLEDAEPGEELLLLTYWHQPRPSPYAAAGPIFVRRQAHADRVVRNAVPLQQQRRLLSVRAYDGRHHIVDSDVTPGRELEVLIRRFFERPGIAYLQVHNARHGCYACRVDRA